MELDFLNTNKRFLKRESYIKKHHNSLYVEICNYSYDKNIKFIQKLYNYLNKIESPPKCKICLINNLNFISFTSGYSKHCSLKCTCKDIEVKEKKENTNIINYGYSNVLKSNEIKNKIKLTNKLKFDCDNPFSNLNIINDLKLQKRNKEIINWNKKLKKKDVIIEYLDNDLYKIFNYCEHHNSFIITRQSLYSRIFRQNMDNVCTECTPINKNVSNIENSVKFFIENELQISTIKKKLLNKQEIDIYMPMYNLGIEFNGLYYHSNKFKGNSYHLNKLIQCEKENIDLIQIFEDEWINKTEIVKSIIKSKLNIYEDIISANDCKIENIDTITANNYASINYLFDYNYLYDYYNVGLKYKNDIVLLITFIKLNDKSDYQMVIIPKLNVNIINGMFKIINHFILNYSPEKLLIYQDRRYFNFENFNELGFDLIDIIEPKFYYFNVNKTNKKMLYNNVNENLLKIYDCGFKIFKLNIWTK